MRYQQQHCSSVRYHSPISSKSFDKISILCLGTKWSSQFLAFAKEHKDGKLMRCSTSENP